MLDQHRAPRSWPCRCWRSACSSPSPALASAGRRVQRSRYRPDRWRLARAGGGRLRRGRPAIVGWYVAGHQPLIAYPPLDVVPQVSALALLGTAVGLVGGALRAARRRTVPPDPPGGDRVIELRGITFALRRRRRPATASTSPSTRASWCSSPGRPASASPRCSAWSPGWCPRFSGRRRCDGDVLLDGASIVRTPPRERAHVVGYVGQDPAAGFVTDTVEEELAYGMEQLGLEPATMRRRVEETLDLLGIADLRSPRPAHPLRRPAAAGGDRLGAHHAPAAPGPRRAHLGARPDRRRGGAGHPDPPRARPGRLRAAGRAPAGAGGAVRGPDVPALRRRPRAAWASPRDLLEHSPVVPPIVELAGPPAGRRCRSASATPAGGPGLADAR